jgi:hypothetical protein
MLCRKKGDSKLEYKMYLQLKKGIHNDTPYFCKNFVHNCQVLEQHNNKLFKISRFTAQNGHMDYSIESNPCLRRKSYIQN